MWIQRTCIVCQWKFKDRTDVELLRHTIHRLKSSRAFFVQKAIGWTLRQCARTDADWVLKVVHEEDLKPLSKLQALKHL
jgi:3-methyladenine DNA glycosylase AlkD